LEFCSDGNGKSGVDENGSKSWREWVGMEMKSAGIGVISVYVQVRGVFVVEHPA